MDAPLRWACWRGFDRMRSRHQWAWYLASILLVIAVPSFKLLFFQLIPPPADLTVKATGKQWFWSYSYPDNGNYLNNSSKIIGLFFLFKIAQTLLTL